MSAFFNSFKKTGCFCLSSCHFHNPMDEPSITFETTRAALENGYLPCDRCKPMHVIGNTPSEISILLNELAQHATLPLHEKALLQRGLRPSEVDHWFQINHGLNIQAYARYLQINTLFGYHRLEDHQPMRTPNADTLVVTRLATPLGPMLAGASEKGICLLEYVGRKLLLSQIKTLGKYFSANIVPGVSPYFTLLNTQLKEYFMGERRVFQVPLDIPSTKFQISVWEALLKIPYGRTISYLDQAKAIDHPKAVRAVANANGRNRVSILLPCHRVIGKDGRMTGYGGEVWRKEYLLNLESMQT